jgi:methylated-DNA-protein-cysteine methyltransferase related protein
MANLKASQVLNMVHNIPSGRVASYGDIAARCGAPSNARQVGAILRDYAAEDDANPAPWHRVVNSQGAISERIRHWQGGSDALQKVLLEDEGVGFILSGAKPRVNMKKFRWVDSPTP